MNKKIFFICFSKNLFFWKNNISSAIFFSVFGFLISNNFGTFFPKICFFGDGFFFFFIISFFELITFQIYSKRKKKNDTRSVFLVIKTSFFWKMLNFVKIGSLIGFFIEAFKVGS